MKTTFRSYLVFTGLTMLWSQVFLAAGLCQATNVSDRIRIGVYPALFSSPQIPAGAEPQLKADSAFVRWSKQLSALLATALLKENLNVLPPDSIVAFLQSRPAFDPFHPDSMRTLCTAFAMQKLVMPILSAASETAPGKALEPPLRIRLILRWLDGASGEVTKLHAGEYQVRRDGAFVLADDFDAHAAIQALLSAPELIISPEETMGPLPLPLTLPEPAITSHKSSKWWWYLSAAAVIGGGSAYWFLGRGESENNPTLLPEPPDPPSQ
jgi:hypothetical protein